MMRSTTKLLVAVLVLLVGECVGAPRGTTELRQSDFANGTYRILSSGRYELKEDIFFAPRPDNDYWPELGDPEYPASAFFLGFFAAITVETDDVVIDLNGFCIQQGKEFYLKQRFFNTIELNNRVFVPNEGVSSLNYQEGDPLRTGERAPKLRANKNIRIQNGVLGAASHNNIHGNGVVGLLVSGVTMKDFEIAGFQCNGCEDVEVSGCVVGPSSTKVPAMSTFSNARFTSFFTKTLIPGGFEREGAFKEPLKALFKNKIRFSGREEETTLEEVFDRLEKLVNIFTDHYMGRLINDKDKAILSEAIELFSNQRGLPDGSVLYGIFINQLGVPQHDDNYYGEPSTRDITIRNTTISGLRSHPIEVPALRTVTGSFLQGVARDVLRVMDVTKGAFRMLTYGTYTGNALSDAYFALWQMSNDFYNIRVYDSECANFGSNATTPYTTTDFRGPAAAAGQCLGGGTVKDSSLTGRDVTMLQKRYFGGLKLSQKVYDWATTDGMTVNSLLETPGRTDERQQNQHELVCGYDTMFHPMTGVIGLKLNKASNVELNMVEINNLVNLADDEHYVCRLKWRMSKTGELIAPVNDHLGGSQTATVKGIEAIFSENIALNRVNVRNLDSEEGSVRGIQVRGDTNDRSYGNGPTEDPFTLFFVEVSDLKSGHGDAIPYMVGGVSMDIKKKVGAGLPEIYHNGLKNPRVNLQYRMPGVVPEGPNIGLVGENEAKQIMRTTKFDTLEKLAEFRVKVLAYYNEKFGIEFEPGWETTNVWDPVAFVDQNDGKVTDSFVILQRLNPSVGYNVISACVETREGSGCTDYTGKSPVKDFFYTAVVGPSGYTFYGTFGREEGHVSPPGSFFFCGLYSIESLELPYLGNVGDLQIEFFPECPVSYMNVSESYTLYINCIAENPFLGTGWATGGYLFHPIEDEEYAYRSDSYSSIYFEDVPGFRKDGDVNSVTFPEDVKMEMTDIMIPFIADGVLPTKAWGQLAANPLHSSYHYTHEAGIYYLKKFTQVNTDEKISQLRTQFLARLRDYYGIKAVSKYMDKDNNWIVEEPPLDGEVDLGRGQIVTAYEVNHDANMRAMNVLGEGTNRYLGTQSRVHEGGFRLFVGRAGILSDGKWKGFLNFGSLITEGVYVIQGAKQDNTDLEVNFYSTTPLVYNPWATGILEQETTSEWGEGKVIYTVTPPRRIDAGVFLNNHGSFFFGEKAYWDGSLVMGDKRGFLKPLLNSSDVNN